MEKLGAVEYRFAQIIWQHEPLSSGGLVILAKTELGWKKSTTYTVLKKLCDKGIIKNDHSMVTSIIKQEEMEYQESKAFVERTFDGSLPRFLAAFMQKETLNDEQAEELKALIDQYRKENPS